MLKLYIKRSHLEVGDNVLYPKDNLKLNIIISTTYFNHTQIVLDQILSEKERL